VDRTHEQGLLDRLIDRLRQREALDCEFKGAGGGIPKSLWPTISAFANTNGGWILLGISENEDGTGRIDGLSRPEEIVQTLYDQLRNPEKISYPVCGSSDISVQTLGDRAIIVIRVPAASRRARPVFINGNPYRGTFIRRHGGDFHCTKQEVDRMMRDASELSADSAVLPHFDLEDIDPESFQRFRRLHRLNLPNSPFHGYEDLRFLSAIGAWGRDRERGLEGLTLAGLLLLGEQRSILEWRPRHLIDYRRLPESTPSSLDERWDDRLAWNGNLLDAFNAIFPRLTGDLPVKFRLQGLRRVDEGPVQIALREALVNLLVHADYSEPNASLILRSPEGYLLRNPGSSLVPEADLLKGSRSDPRNPTLVRMFRLIGFSEEAGTGIPKIVQAWHELGLRVPKIDTGTERYEFSIELRHAHLLAEEDRLWLRRMGDDWDEAEQMALVYARHEGEIDNATLRRLTGIHAADATKVLGKLSKDGLLHRLGVVGPGVRYHLAEFALEQLVDSTDSVVAPKQTSEVLRRGHASSMEGMPEHMEDTAQTMEGMDENMEGWGNTIEDSDDLDSLFETGREKLPTLRAIAAAAAKTRRLNPRVRDQILISLCRVMPLSIQQIAGLLGRHPQDMRVTVRQLVAQGFLVPSYPEKPRHPKQKYTAAVLREKDATHADPAQADLDLS
jgi:predicted HTH transcriptional regulator